MAPLKLLGSMVWLLGSATGLRKAAKHRERGPSSTVHLGKVPGAEFRGAFRDLSLWVDAKDGPSDLWVVEFTKAEDLVSERRRAESAGLSVLMQENQSLVMRGNVPGVLGYDACGGEPDKNVISVANREVRTVPMPPDEASRHLAKAQTADPWIASLLEQVSQSRITETITTLQSYTTRNSYSGSAGLDQAADWAAQQLVDYGFQVTRDTFRANMTPQIIAELTGTESPDKIVVFGAHLDSTAGWSSSPTSRSPGADDNGSGSSSVLEFARLVASNGARFKNTLRLCLFTGEEQGLVGSRALAGRWADAGVDVVAMINVDMLGYRNPGTPLTITVKVAGVDPALTEVARASTTTYLPQFPQGDSSSCCSDMQSFTENGYPAMGFFEQPTRASDYPHYHTSTDLLQYFDPEGVTAQATAAFAMTSQMAELLPLAPTPAPPPTPPPPPTPVPTPAPTPAPGTWIVTGDGCEMAGDCIQSKNHPGNYGNNEACSIDASNVALTVAAFSTESRYDFLTIGGTRYSGTSGPPSGTYSGVISWSSDYSVTNSGWKLCKA